MHTPVQYILVSDGHRYFPSEETKMFKPFVLLKDYSVIVSQDFEWLQMILINILQYVSLMFRWRLILF